jgi:DNA-binding IclR family transcriptional regulator
MARPALSAARALDVLDFLAAHPDETFTLSDLVRRVGVNVASMHALLAVLEQREYVSRDEDKAYGLGPMLVPLGYAARRRHAVIDAARHALESLAADLGVTGLVVAASDGEMVVIDEVATVAPPHIARTRAIGRRIRMLPPIGGVFYAWSTDSAVEQWLESAPKAMQRHESDLRRWLTSIRTRGYAVGLETAARQGLRRAVRDLTGEPGSRSARGRLRNNVARLGDIATVLIEPNPHESYRVSHVAAAVVDRPGATPLSLYLMGFRRELSAYELERIGARLRVAAAGVARGTGDAVPEDDRDDAGDGARTAPARIW